MPKLHQGALDATGLKVALCVSRFNAFITDRLLDGAVDALVRHGAKDEDLEVFRVPGAWELPFAARQAAKSGRFDAVIALGCLIRGDTLHYELIAGEVTRGLARSMEETGIPVAFGVLTCDTLTQAIERAGAKAGNKGADAAVAAIELVRLVREPGQP